MLPRSPRNSLENLEVRAGIEPAYADLQSDASPLCHRTPERRAVYPRRTPPGQERPAPPTPNPRFASGAHGLYKPATSDRNEPVMAPPIQTTPHDDFLIDARNRMVDSQLRPNKVSDPRILDAMRRLPREQFLPAPLLARAYADDNVPLGGGRVLLQPMVLARLMQAAMPLPGEKALVIGSGTGYSAALLAAMGCEVTALEENPTLLALAKPVLERLAPGVTLVSGPPLAGWAANAPYDLILIEGAVPEVPGVLGGQLNRETGRLLTIVVPGGAVSGVNTASGHAAQATPTQGGVSVRALFDCVCPMLPGFATAPVFEF